MRISACAANWLRNAREVEQLHSFVPSLCLRHAALQLKHFGNLIANHHQRVQGRHGFLKHKCNVLTADVDELTLAQFDQVMGVRCIGGIWVQGIFVLRSPKYAARDTRNFEQLDKAQRGHAFA